MSFRLGGSPDGFNIENDGTINPSAIKDCAASVGTAGQVLSSTGTALEWVAAGGSSATPTVEGVVYGSTGAASNCQVSLGYNSGLNVSGVDNTFVGPTSGWNVNQAGRVANYNTALGSRSLWNISADGAQSNVAVGYWALGGGQVPGMSGSGNVAIGSTAALNLTSASLTVAVGNGVITGTTGGCNTYVGAFVNIGFTGAITGVNNTVIGYQACQPYSGVNNTVTLGNSSVTVLRAAVTTISSLSDARDKTDVTALPVGLDFVNSLNPVKFTWQMREANEVKDGTSEAGFIAQELLTAQQTAGADYLGLVYDGNPEKLEASPGKLLPVLVKAIQELSAKNDALEARIAQLEANG